MSYFSHAVLNNLPALLFALLHANYGLSFEQLGRLVFINFGTRLLIDGLAIRLADKIGYRACLISAHIFAALGLLLFSGLPAVLPQEHVLLGLSLTMVVFSAGGGLIQVLISPIINQISDQLPPGAMILLHSTYPWGTVITIAVTTLALWLTPEHLWHVIPIAWMVIPLITLWGFITAPMAEPRMSETPTMTLRELSRMPSFWTTCGLMPLAGMTEAGMAQWGSVFIEKALMFPKIMGDLIGPMVASLIMATIRMTFPRWSKKLPLEKVLRVAAAGSAVCFAAAALIPRPVFALAAITCSGIFIAMLWPGTVLRSAERFTNGGTPMFGMLSLGGDIGAAAGPWIIGVVSDRASLHGGMLSGALFPLGYLALLLVDQRNSKKDERNKHIDRLG